MTAVKATDRVDRVRELQAQLERQVADLVSGADWIRMLDTASRFHRYSANNLMLIMCQMPEATRVAGFQTWKSLGRFVRKGEHGIRILAPCKYKIETEDGNDVWRLAGFTTVSVFDISQTDGAALDEIRPELLEGDSPAGLWDSLAAQVAAEGFTLGQCLAHEIGGANGQTDYSARTVMVRSDVSDAQACKTLAHELGHILCDHEHELNRQGCRGRLEVEAESVAYIVAAACGMPTDGYSLPYVGLWSGGDVSVVRHTAEKVVRAAGVILGALGGAEVAEVAA